MNAKSWIKYWFCLMALIPLGAALNYFVDPYGIYNTDLLHFDKIRQASKIRLVKTIKIKEIKPKSIVMGTSRAEIGYDPEHTYFAKPSFNCAISASTMYESKLNLQLALKQGNLEQVLLVLDYRMFNSFKHKALADFETYFDDKNIYSYLFSIDTLEDSISTIQGTHKYYDIYLENGQMEHSRIQRRITENGGHLKLMDYSDSVYYKNFFHDYIYRDTGKSSFQDLEEITALCYKNDIKLDLIFGPSHVRQWEGLDHFIGYDKWLQWKKDVVTSVDKTAKEFNKKQYRIYDFAVYHPLTAEDVPKDKNVKMKYHWESSHYKSELGSIVLDRLNGDSSFTDFGVVLNVNNIDEHLILQRRNRKKYIDINSHHKEIFRTTNTENTL